MSKDYANIIYEKKPPIAYIAFNRPTSMNALAMALQLEARDALENAGWQDDDIRVIVIKGAGHCFSSGFDMIEGNDEGTERNAAQWRAHFFKSKGFHSSAFWDVFWNNPKPLIAQVHSYCLGGAMAALSFCDLCICSEDALFGYPNVRVGGPFLAGVWPWILGMRKALELLFTGNLIDAQEACRLGLVNKVVSRDKLEDEVNKLAQTIAKVPALANEYNKKLVHLSYELMGIRQAIEHSDELESISYCGMARPIPEREEFQRIRKDKGLKAALGWRNSRFAEEDAWWKERRKKAEDKR